MKRLPNRLPRPPGELEALRAAWRPPRGWRVAKSVNNVHVGLMYIATSLVFFVGAGVLALVMRAQLALPDADLVSPRLYNQLFTMHGTVMMFLFAVPVVEAVAVFLLPNMLGARDLPFPRLSAYAFWAYAFGGAAFFATVFFDAAPDAGWFMYPPLSSAAQSPGIGADFWLLGIGFIEISAIAGAIELIVGILWTRAPGMTLGRMPVYAWAMLVVGVMIVLAFPAVIAGTALLELERAFDWPFFIPERGGDPVLWQHLFWFFGHPEVYIIFLPAAGLVSMMLPTLAGTPLVGRRAVILALAATGAFSFALWAHHMFTAGLGVLTSSLVSAASMAVAVPAGMQVFAWLATLRAGRLRWTPAALFLLGFLFIFVIGGLTGVMVAALPFDRQAHDSYFIVAHLHYVLIGGMVFPLFAALYHWTPLINGHAMSERVARWVFGLMFGGFHLAFFPMHVSGLLGMPRRVYTYGADTGWAPWNGVSSVGAFVLAAGVLLFLVDAVRTWRRPEQDHGDPWRAPTLEWLPNEAFGVRSIPQVEGREPLWQRPALAAEVEAGSHWLPGTTSGGRETLATTPVAARLSHLVRLPGDGWSPMVAAAGTAGFFLLLTVKLTWLAWACAALGTAAALQWLWASDAAPHARRAQVGEGVEVPVGAAGRRSHAWWAAAVLSVVDLTIWASFAFAHLHVSMRAAVCPPPGASLPAAAPTLAAALLWAGSSVPLLLAQRMPARRWPVALLACAAGACTAAAFALQWDAHATLQPRADAWSATVAALLAYQGVHAVLAAVFAAYLAARAWAHRVAPDRRSTLDNVALLGHVAGLQGVLGIALMQWLPGWLP